MEPLNTKDYLDMDLLRFTTAGSVDDGKSTLIGRLLYDSKSIFEDQLKAVETSSKKTGDGHINLALLTDGLRAEREQGITIDVAYRYFATPKRKFIIADTPGHIQYTRNMVTGASTANLAIILIDARNGVIEQTKRHSHITSLLQIKHAIVCINKMDLVDYDQDRFLEIKKDFESLKEHINIPDIKFIPISALNGDNVVNDSKEMPWYNQGSLLYNLEHVKLDNIHNYTSARYPIQSVIRPYSKEYHDFRGYAGRVSGGVFKVGEKVIALPSKLSTTIKSIETLDGPLQQAFPPMSVCITLNDDIDLGRGDMLVKEDAMPTITQEITLIVCWLNQKPLKVGNKYLLKHTTKEIKCIVKSINYSMDIDTLSKHGGIEELPVNGIGEIEIKTTSSLFIDPYTENRKTGSIIFMDEFSNETVGAGMVVK